MASTGCTWTNVMLGLAVTALALLCASPTSTAIHDRNLQVDKVQSKNGWATLPFHGARPRSALGPRTLAAMPSSATVDRIDLPSAYSQIFTGWNSSSSSSFSHSSELTPRPPNRLILAKGGQNSSQSSTDEFTAADEPESELMAALMETYDKTVHPKTDDGSPVVVEVNVALNKIVRMDLQEGSMELNVWFRLHWKDPRLAWNATEWGVHRLFILNQELRYMDIWYPDVTLWNSANDVASTLGAQAPILRPTGDVFWGRNGMLNVACNFKGLAAFPFGAVRCLMEIGTWSHGPLTVVVKEAPQGGATIAGNSITDMRGAKAVEWKFHSVRSWIHHYPAYPCCPDESNWPVLLVDLELYRTQTLFALKILVPQVVLALAGFMTFWLGPECGERLGVAVTVPLALAVYDLLVYSTLPASDDISCIGAIGLLGFLFSVMTLAINGAVIQLFHYREPRWWMGSGTIWAIWLRFRQQQVWGLLLEVLDKLETELIKQHLKESQAAKRERQAQNPTRQRRLSFMGDWRSKAQPTGQEDAAPRKRESLTGQLSIEPAASDVDGRQGDAPAVGRRISITGTKTQQLSRVQLLPQPSRERFPANSTSLHRAPSARPSDSGAAAATNGILSNMPSGRVSATPTLTPGMSTGLIGVGIGDEDCMANAYGGDSRYEMYNTIVQGPAGGTRAPSPLNSYRRMGVSGEQRLSAAPAAAGPSATAAVTAGATASAALATGEGAVSRKGTSSSLSSVPPALETSVASIPASVAITTVACGEKVSVLQRNGGGYPRSPLVVPPLTLPSTPASTPPPTLPLPSTSPPPLSPPQSSNAVSCPQLEDLPRMHYDNPAFVQERRDEHDRRRNDYTYSATARYENTSPPPQPPPPSYRVTEPGSTGALGTSDTTSIHRSRTESMLQQASATAALTGRQESESIGAPYDSSDITRREKTKTSTFEFGGEPSDWKLLEPKTKRPQTAALMTAGAFHNAPVTPLAPATPAALAATAAAAAARAAGAPLPFLTAQHPDFFNAFPYFTSKWALQVANAGAEATFAAAAPMATAANAPASAAAAAATAVVASMWQAATTLNSSSSCSPDVLSAFRESRAALLSLKTTTIRGGGGSGGDNLPEDAAPKRPTHKLSDRGGDGFIELAIRKSMQGEDSSTPQVSAAATIAQGEGTAADAAILQQEEVSDTQVVKSTMTLATNKFSDSSGMDRVSHHGPIALPCPPAPPPPPPAAPPPPTRSATTDGHLAMVSPGQTEETTSQPLPAPVVVQESVIDVDGVGGGGGGGTGPSQREMYGFPWRAGQGPIPAQSALTRAPSRLRRQGSLNVAAMASGSSGIAATMPVVPAPPTLPPLASSSGRLPQVASLLPSRSWGRDGSHGSGVKGSLSGGTTIGRYNRLAIDGMLLHPMPPLLGPNETDGDDGLAPVAAPGAGLQPVAEGPAGLGALKRLVPRKDRPRSASLERGIDSPLASRSARRMITPMGPITAGAALWNSGGSSSAPADSSTAAAAGGGRNTFQRYGTTGNLPLVSQPLRHTDSELSDGAATNAIHIATRSPARFLNSGLIIATHEDREAQIRSGGEDLDLERDLDLPRPLALKFTEGGGVAAFAGTTDGDGGGGGGGYGIGGGISSGIETDMPAVRSRPRAHSEYGAWAAASEEPDQEQDLETGQELTLNAVLHVGSPEQLETYLQLILDNPSQELLAVRERVANAVNVFGMEELVMRLFPIVGRPEGNKDGGGRSGHAPGGSSFRYLPMYGSSRRGVFRGGRRMATSSGLAFGSTGGQVGAKADFHRMIGDEYNAKWRLLSSFIDANCRYLMPLLYCVCFILIIWAKVWANRELDDGPSPEKSAQGLQR